MTDAIRAIKELRERTGAGVLDCKTALEETMWDVEQAVDLLRKRSLATEEVKETFRQYRTNASVAIQELMEENERWKAEVDRLVKILQRIEQWSYAYPLSVFPEPDFAKAQELLKAGGESLDNVSAAAMRHVVEIVAEMAREAWEPQDDQG